MCRSETWKTETVELSTYQFMRFRDVLIRNVEDRESGAGV